MYAAFAIAAIIGVATFLIWWITSDVRRFGFGGAPPATTAVTPPAFDTPIETALPRGGTLTGSTDDMDLAARRLTGAPLVRVNRSTDQVEPWLAQSWTASPDNLIYTLTLRPGLMAADGTALTAAGVVKAMGTVVLINTPPDISAIDPLTVEIRFAAPFAAALRMLDHIEIDGFGPFVGGPGAKGSGPRRFKRNPHYWRKAEDGSALPYLDEIVLTARPTSTARATLDFDEASVRAEDFEALRKLEQDGRARIYQLGPGLDADALWFCPLADLSRRSAEGAKADRPWLFDERFRQAISIAVDRRDYCKQVFYGACDPMAGPVSPANVSWFNPDFPLGPGNPELARKMLEQLGLRDRNGDGLLDDATRRALRFTLLIDRDISSSARAATFLAATLKTIGVQMDVTPVDADTLAARQSSRSYDAIYDRIHVRDTDPALNLDLFSSGYRPGSDTPPPTDRQRRMDELMMKNVTSVDRIERLQAFVDAQKIYLQHLPKIFFGVPHVRIATGMRTVNATPSPLRPHLLWNAEDLAALK